MMYRKLPTSLIDMLRTTLSALCAVSLVMLIGAAPKSEPIVLPTVKPAVNAEHAAELLHDIRDSNHVVNSSMTRVDDTIRVTNSPEVKSPRQMRMEVTAYCACSKCCGPNAVGITASGLHVSYNEGRFVAADPSFAFGTKLLIPGYSDQAVEVIDRGSAIRGDKLDVYFSSHEAALEWGRQVVAVTVVE